MAHPTKIKLHLRTNLIILSHAFDLLIQAFFSSSTLTISKLKICVITNDPTASVITVSHGCKYTAFTAESIKVSKMNRHLFISCHGCIYIINCHLSLCRNEAIRSSQCLLFICSRRHQSSLSDGRLSTASR